MRIPYLLTFIYSVLHVYCIWSLFNADGTYRSVTWYFLASLPFNPLIKFKGREDDMSEHIPNSFGLKRGER